MSFAQQLANHIHGFYFGPNQTGVHLEQALADVDLDWAQRKVGDHNSILALVFHIDYYVRGLTEVLRGGDLTIRDKYSYDYPILTSEVAWLKMKTDVLANGKVFGDMIGAMDDQALNGAFVKPQYGNNYRNFAGMVEHAHYHLGQILLIKKLTRPATGIFPRVLTFCEDLAASFDQIQPARKELLDQLGAYVKAGIGEGKRVQLNTICTHNSRRSHLGQLWLAIGADYYGLTGIKTYSGGTEATAFNPRAVAAMQRVGLHITSADFATENPVYQVQWATGQPAYVVFSKAYDQPPNPRSNYGAIMVCSEADAGCPTVFGADFRLALPFEDPKAFDDTEFETTKYDERVRDIGREMLYALSMV